MRPWPTPLAVSIDITPTCDLACAHCRHAGDTTAGPGLLFADIARVIDDCSRMRVFRFVISGGEPFLRDDLVEISLRALRSEIGRVFISTNGQSVDLSRLVPLLSFRNRLTFKMSLDGPDDFHDGLRGRRGACSVVKGAIAELVGAGFQVHVNTTLMRANVSALPGVLDWVAASGASRHNLIEVIPVGRATPEMAITQSQRTEALCLIQRAVSKHRHRGHTIVAKVPFAQGPPSGFRCSGGTEDCGILADGSVVGCRLMPDLIEGNVRKRSLADIWGDQGSFRLFRRISREALTGPCWSCESAAICLGGCHAHARASSGSFHGPDGRCIRPFRFAVTSVLN